MILSQRGWIRAAKGHLPLDGDFKFKEGDGPAFALHAQTTDKLLFAVDNGRFYTLGADKLPGARGCTWARRATHHLVHGRQLLGAGFNLSRALDEAQLRQNEKAIEDVLAAHPSRCCDC